MSLGGLAVAIGMLVDGSVVMVENIYRHLSDRRHQGMPRQAIILDSAREVSRPIVFGIVIIVIVFLPLITLEGMEGKLFAPMAYTIMIALLVSLALSLTLSPSSVCGLCVPAAKRIRSRFDGQRSYLPRLEWALNHPRSVMLGATGLLLGSLLLVPFLGGEFIPTLDEGALTPQVFRLPDISLDNSTPRRNGDPSRPCASFRKSLSNVSKIGRSEIALDPMEVERERSDRCIETARPVDLGPR